MADPQWKKNLRTASFRGISFKVESHSRAGGRRGVQHEYAQRDEPFTEDTGRKGRKFSFSAYILGTDYMPERDRLIKALEDAGPGELIHPYHGRQVVNCFDYTSTESTTDGGLVKFQLSFVEAGQEAFPDSRIDALSATSAAAEALRKSKFDEFVEKFSVAQRPQFVLDSATAKVRDTSDKLAAVQDRSGGFLASSAAAAAEIAILRSRAETLIGTPGELFGQTEKAFGILFDSITNKRSGFEAAGKLTTYGNSDAPTVGTTETRNQERENKKQQNSMTRLLALSEAAVAAVQVDFESTNDAQNIKLFMLNAIENESNEDGISDDVYTALQDLRVEIARHVPGDLENLAVVSNVTPRETTTSLTVAYDVYGSVALEDEVVKRNNIRSPGFVSANAPVEVLLSEDQ